MNELFTRDSFTHSFITIHKKTKKSSLKIWKTEKKM